jgi:general secretion pathway protein D
MWGKVWRKTPGSVWLAVVLGGVLLCVGCSSASVAFKEGRRAEEQKDYDSAVVDFQKALQTQPNNTRIQIYEKQARAEASLAHLQLGRELLRENRPEQAAGEFQKAVSIDPSNQAAAQELQRIVLNQAAAASRRQSAIRQAMQAQEQAQTAGVQLKPLSRAVIPTLNLAGNSREVFRALGDIAGVNVVFYHDFESRAISLHLSSVTIEDALHAASAEAGVFWKAITPNTILIIPDTPMNRQNLESNVLKTVYLQNPMEAQDRMAILTAVKQVIGLQLKAFDNPDANAIVLYGEPELVDEAEQLIRGLDRGQAEVLIDVDVLEADKSYMRDLGLEPVPITNDTLGVLGFNPSTTTSTTTSSGQATTTPYVPLNQLGKIGTKDFSVVLSGVVANALLTDNRTHILQSPQVRVTAGQKATLKIGEQVPFATGSFGVPTASVTSSTTSAYGLLANTQFNYKDVGVDLSMQPYVAANGDIVLHAHVTVSAVGTPTNIGGVEEPVFTDREVEHVIRLREGQTTLLGGLIQTQTTRSVTGLPGLAEVPILKYFFSDQTYNVQDEEVLIMMTPHIVRLPESTQTAASNESPAVAEPPAPSRMAPGLPRRGGIPQ